MEIFSFDGKKVNELNSLEEINRKHPTWIRFLDKSDEMIDAVANFTSIPAEEFKNFFEYEERSRLEQGRFLEIIYQVPFKEKGEIVTEPVNFFFVDHLFISVERSKTSAIEKISSTIKSGKLKFLFRGSIGQLLYYFLDKINDDFLNSIDRIANLTDVLESKGENVSNDQLMRLYQYNVTLTHFNQALIANLEVLAGLRKSYYKKFTKEDIEKFNELYYDKLQVLDTEKIQREVITNLFNLQTVVATHKLNKFMKRLTTLALVFVVPTFITGLFGMNVTVPFANSPYGFLIICAIILFCIGILLVLFKKLDWL